jgi:hypothetical protein
MIVFDAHFKPLTEVTIDELFDAIGVYVLWGPRVKNGPSYIGEGLILSRFVDHLDWIRRPFTGLVAILGNKNSRNQKDLKWRAETIEHALLGISSVIGRYPTRNKTMGHSKPLGRMLDRSSIDHNVLRFRFSGKDPLASPKNPQMKKPKIVDLEWNKYDELWTLRGRLPWRRH